jgi:hypothetical protein
MAALTGNKYDVYEWIKKVIFSCNSYHHYTATNRLISQFYFTYNDIELSGSLRNYVTCKEFDIK